MGEPDELMHAAEATFRREDIQHEIEKAEQASNARQAAFLRCSIPQNGSNDSNTDLHSDIFSVTRLYKFAAHNGIPATESGIKKFQALPPAKQRFLIDSAKRNRAKRESSKKAKKLLKKQAFNERTKMLRASNAQREKIIMPVQSMLRVSIAVREKGAQERKKQIAESCATVESMVRASIAVREKGAQERKKQIAESCATVQSMVRASIAVRKKRAHERCATLQ